MYCNRQSLYLCLEKRLLRFTFLLYCFTFKKHNKYILKFIIILFSFPPCTRQSNRPLTSSPRCSLSQCWCTVYDVIHWTSTPWQRTSRTRGQWSVTLTHTCNHKLKSSSIYISAIHLWFHHVHVWTHYTG